MTITELKYIIALAQEQHFGRAAQRVFVSQPTLSIGIKKLEDELGIQIFERLTNKVTPTAVGKRIIEAAQNTLMSTETIRSIADEAKGEFSGVVKMGAIYTVCPYLLPKIIPDLQTHSPTIQLYIKEDYTANLIEALKDGTLDVALVSLPIESSNLFEIKPLFEEDFLAILPRKHSLHHKQQLTPEDFDGERVFLLGNGNCFRDQVLAACPNCQPPTMANSLGLQGGSLETIRMMVAGGLGVSIFPRMALNEDSLIIARPFRNPSPKRKIALIWRKSLTNKALINSVEASILRCK